MTQNIPEPGEVDDPDLGIPGDAEPLPDNDADAPDPTEEDSDG